MINRDPKQWERFIRELLDRQDRGAKISAYHHGIALELIDAKLLGTVGFRYCTVEDAREDRRRLERFNPGSKIL
jgi:hypothetical protein